MTNKICPLMTAGENIVHCQKYGCAWYVSEDCIVVYLFGIGYELNKIREVLQVKKLPEEE